MTGPILIVDDEFGILDTLRDLLEDEGYRTATALNGRLALQRMAEERPSLVLLDFMMPVMSGPEVITAMRADPSLRDVPIVLMSAGPPSSWSALPCQGFLPKPFKLEQLLDFVEKFAAGAKKGA